MSVRLEERKGKTGVSTFRLVIHHGGKRWRENIDGVRLLKPITLADKQENKVIMANLKALVIKKEYELLNPDYKPAVKDEKSRAVDWFESYVNGYAKKDKRNINGVVGRFKDFLVEKKKGNILLNDISPILIEDFIEYLQSKSIGEGAVSYYKRFKKMMFYAYRSKAISTNVVDFVTKKPKGKARKKDILTLPELQLLSHTPTKNDDIKRAFLFTCVTGLRHCDIRLLDWGKIDINSRTMKVLQEKTKHHSEEVVLPLNETALRLLGEKSTGLVFDLPSHNACNKTIKAWVKRSGIEKTITWHNGRHSFGTNLIFNDVDVYTASKLLGHASLKHTERYVRASAEMKQRGSDKIVIDL